MLREYGDADGVRWRVWNVEPSSHGSAQLPGRLAAGWLCFDCGSEKRRLAPVPPRWDRRSETELDLFRRAAEVVPPRRG